MKMQIVQRKVQIIKYMTKLLFVESRKVKKYVNLKYNDSMAR